jgi:ELWxxDGT repeat protein
MAAVNGTLFFAAYEDSMGMELWKSDGTWDGTVLVKDIDPLGSSDPYELTAVNGTLFFRTDDGITDREIWKSDGTPEGTMLLKDINTTPGWSYYPEELTNVNGTLFFTAHDGTTGREVWKSDGTTEGTVLVKDINPWPGTSIDVEVTYSPTAPGDHQAFLHVYSNSVSPANDLYLPLTGKGAGGNETKIYSYLGDDPWCWFPDQDVFRFEGEEGEEVTLTLEEAEGDNTGEHATLILKDKINCLWFFKKDKSDLPNEITAVLPASGEYRVWIAEQSCFLPGEPFEGNYCLTLESSGEAYASLEPAYWVE